MAAQISKKRFGLRNVKTKIIFKTRKSKKVKFESKTKKRKGLKSKSNTLAYQVCKK